MKTLRKLNFFLITVCLLVFALTTTITGQIYKKVLFDNTYETTLGFLRQMEFNFSEKKSKFEETTVSLLAGENLKRLDVEPDLSSAYAYETINGFNKEVLGILSQSDDVASIIYLTYDDTLIGTDGKTVWREKAGDALLARLEDAQEGTAFQGGFSAGLFYENKEYLGKQEENYLSIVVPYRGRGKLIVNVREKAFRNVFSSTIRKNDGEIYILDGSGSILSSTNDGEIGKQYGRTEQMRDKRTPFYVREGEELIIYYALPKMGWSVVWEKELNAFYEQARLLQHILVGFVLFSLAIILASYAFYAKMLLKPLHRLIRAMEDIGRGNYGIQIEESMYGEIGNVIRSFNRMSQDIRILTRENVRITNEKRTLQLLALQEQMSPHFVLNALNTIKWMAMLTRQENIVNMVIALSKIIHAFKNTDAFGTIGQEIEFIRNYILVMNYRYGDVIHVHYEVDGTLTEISIPIFFIQPLVENCLKHGFASTNCKGDIFIRVNRAGEEIRIAVSDNGRGMDRGKMEELNRKLRLKNQMPLLDTGGVGLMNIAKRMWIYYGEKASITVKNNRDCGVCTELTLPLQ